MIVIKRIWDYIATQLAMIKIEEYRNITKDYVTTDEKIKMRIDYITSLCRNIAKIEIKNYIKSANVEKNE